MRQSGGAFLIAEGDGIARIEIEHNGNRFACCGEKARLCAEHEMYEGDVRTCKFIWPTSSHSHVFTALRNVSRNSVIGNWKG